MIERLARGFSLIEMVIAIAILGIISAVIAVYLQKPAQGYFDTARRAALTETADNALRRIGRDVRAALPNSVRPGPTNQCFELLPSAGGARYRAELASGGTGNALDFTAPDGSFDVLGAVALPNFAAAASGTYQAVIFNLGFGSADAYAGINRAGLANTSTASTFNLVTATQFPFSSPGKRVHVIENQAVVYSCSGGSLFRSTRAISTSALASCPAGGSQLAANLSACAFDYTQAVNPRFGALAVTLALTASGETVELYHEIHVENVP